MYTINRVKKQTKSYQKKYVQLALVVQVYNPSAWEEAAKGLQVSQQPGLQKQQQQQLLNTIASMQNFWGKDKQVKRVRASNEYFKRTML